jgi:hypothetical protein
MIRGALQVTLLAVALNDLRRRPASQIRGPKPLWVAVSFANYLGPAPSPTSCSAGGGPWPCTDMASRAASVVKRHPLIAFFVLAYAVAWAFVPLAPSAHSVRWSPRWS